ncbi:unnamed protein product, partial [Leptidea sinapis]
MVYELLRQNRLNIAGGGWGMSDEGTTSYQSIIDSYTYSLSGHSREFTSLVAQMGFDALFISPISFDDELIRMQRRALEFIWRGSDDIGRSFYRTSKIHKVNEKTYKNNLHIHLTYSSPSCYVKAVHEANPLLTTKQDDFMPYAYDKFSYVTGLYTSRPDLKYLIREGQTYL